MKPNPAAMQPHGGWLVDSTLRRAAALASLGRAAAPAAPSPVPDSSARASGHRVRRAPPSKPFSEFRAACERRRTHELQREHDRRRSSPAPLTITSCSCRHAGCIRTRLLAARSGRRRRTRSGACPSRRRRHRAARRRPRGLLAPRIADALAWQLGCTSVSQQADGTLLRLQPGPVAQHVRSGQRAVHELEAAAGTTASCRS